jgi:hypothetical protein
MVRCYVKGGSFVKPYFDFESMPSANCRSVWLARVASDAGGFRSLDSLASRRNPPDRAPRSRKVLKMSQKFSSAGAGGFRVDSPVKRPVARKVPGCAPPYTQRPGEEPCQGAYPAQSRRLERSSGTSALISALPFTAKLEGRGRPCGRVHPDMRACGFPQASLVHSLRTTSL